MTVFTIEIEREDDGRWIAEIPALPGVLTYGETTQDASEKVRALALSVIADGLERGSRLMASRSMRRGDANA